MVEIKLNFHIILRLSYINDTYNTELPDGYFKHKQ